MSSTSELLNIALKASDLAERVILDHFNAGVSVEWKPDNTPVTKADKQAEETMREFFAKETPGFGVIGEEFGVESPDAEYQWIVDPIDGTKSFIHGVPLFGTLIALYHKNVPVASVINMPVLNQKVYASNGGGAFAKSVSGIVPAHVSDVELKNGLVLSGTLNTMEDFGYGEKFKELRRSAWLYRGWGDCYGYYLVATGRAEVMVDPVDSLWDIAPMPLILKEAGGHFCTLKGAVELFDPKNQPVAPIYEGFSGVACNAKIFSQVSKIMM